MVALRLSRMLVPESRAIGVGANSMRESGSYMPLHSVARLGSDAMPAKVRVKIKAIDSSRWKALTRHLGRPLQAVMPLNLWRPARAKVTSNVLYFVDGCVWGGFLKDNNGGKRC